MKKTIPFTLFWSILYFSANAQIITKFTWDSNPITTPTTGSTGTSVSTFATSGSGGVGGTNGLSAGTGRHDIDLVVPGAQFTSQPGLDISVDFLKEENGASFFTLGGFDFGITGGSIYVKFVLNVGGSDVAINASNKYNVPNDNLFHTYRFIYNNSTGKADLTVDGVSKYTYQAAANTPLSWTGAVDATIASGMDGGNSNTAVLDNLIIQKPPVLLPLELLSFDAQSTTDGNQLSWTTAREVNTQNFIIEHSTDAANYEAIGQVDAIRSLSGNNHYQFTDKTPAATNFYRLKMVDADGGFSYSPIKKLSNAAAAVSIHCYPNPVIGQVTMQIAPTEAGSGIFSYSVVLLDGKTLQSGMMRSEGAAQQVSIDLRTAPKGILLIRVQQQGMGSGKTQTLKILKQ